jgi:hypothetical protein
MTDKEEHDIRTTVVRGITCKECGNELPPMTMQEHLESRFNTSCPHDFKTAVWELCYDAADGIISEMYRVIDVRAPWATIILAKATKQCDAGHTEVLDLFDSPRWGKIYNARILKDHTDHGSTYKRLKVFSGYGHYSLLLRKVTGAGQNLTR